MEYILFKAFLATCMLSISQKIIEVRPYSCTFSYPAPFNLLAAADKYGRASNTINFFSGLVSAMYRTYLISDSFVLPVKPVLA